jgi:hypothetical protein
MAEDINLLARTLQLARGFYTERDGGPWYIVTPNHGDRIGEGFANRDDARRLLCWLAGDPMPEGWSIDIRPNSNGHDVHIPGRDRATIWKRSVAKYFPNWQPPLA